MKFALVTLATLFITQVAFARNHTMKTVWKDNESTGYGKPMQAGDTLTISLPWKNGSSPRAEINHGSNSDCEVLSVKKVGAQVQVKVSYNGEKSFQIADTNNCSVYIERNHKDDTEDDGLTNLEFGAYPDSSHNFMTRVKWSDEVTDFIKNNINEGDTLTIVLPWKEGSNPKAQVKDDGLNKCTLLSVNRVKQEVQIKVSLDEALMDDGFNGCMIYMERNHESDDESNGTVYLSFGFHIDG